MKERYPQNEVDKKTTFFCLNQLIVLLQTDIEEISQLSKMVRKRGKSFVELNWSQNKRHKTFFFFHFWDLKLVLIDSALNSPSGNLTHYFSKI